MHTNTPIIQLAWGTPKKHAHLYILSEREKLPDVAKIPELVFSALNIAGVVKIQGVYRPLLLWFPIFLLL